MRSFHEIDFVESKEPFYIHDQILKEFEAVDLPAIQIDYIHITDQVRPE